MISIAELYDLFKQHPSACTDTRKVQQGDIFFALKGPNFDGNLFAEKALLAGAAVAVIDDPAFAHITGTVLVEDVLTALQQLAGFHRSQFKIPFSPSQEVMAKQLPKSWCMRSCLPPTKPALHKAT